MTARAGCAMCGETWQAAPRAYGVLVDRDVAIPVVGPSCSSAVVPRVTEGHALGACPSGGVPSDEPGPIPAAKITRLKVADGGAGR